MAEIRAFATDVLGLQVDGHDSEDFVELAMADGSELELFGSAAVADGPWLFEANAVVAGFLVDDIQAARDELALTPGVELLGELRVLAGGYAWQHFRAPDGHVYELTSDPLAVGRVDWLRSWAAGCCARIAATRETRSAAARCRRLASRGATVPASRPTIPRHARPWWAFGVRSVPSYSNASAPRSA